MVFPIWCSCPVGGRSPLSLPPSALSAPLQRLQCAQLPGRLPAAELAEWLCLHKARLEERSAGIVLGPGLLPDGYVLLAVREAGGAGRGRGWRELGVFPWENGEQQCVLP